MLRLSITLKAIITSWLYLGSKSILPVMLWHEGSNVLASFISTPTSAEDFLPLAHDNDVTRVIVLWAIAAILLLATRGWLGYSGSPAVRH